MSEVAIATFILVIVTAAYVIIVAKQIGQSAKHFKIMAVRSGIAMLMQKRYQVESDETQLRIKRAELEGDKQKAIEILDDRHTQCDTTIRETAQRIRELEEKLKKLGEKDC